MYSKPGICYCIKTYSPLMMNGHAVVLGPTKHELNSMEFV